METAVLKSFDNYFSAHILLARLQDAGIQCYLFDEYTATIIPYIGNAIGSIKLVVNQQDREKAIELLQEFEKQAMENSLCPQCGSGNFILMPKQSTPNMLTAILTWLFSSYSISAKNIYQCTHCGFETETLPDNPVINN